MQSAQLVQLIENEIEGLNFGLLNVGLTIHEKQIVKIEIAKTLKGHAVLKGVAIESE